MPLTRITMNRHVIKANKDRGENNPPISIQRGNKVIAKAHVVACFGQSLIIYDPKNPLKCGATAWIQTHDQVQADGRTV